MGCGASAASSANWEKKFSDDGARQRKGVAQKAQKLQQVGKAPLPPLPGAVPHLPDVALSLPNGLPSVPDVSVGMPDVQTPDLDIPSLPSASISLPDTPDITFPAPSCAVRTLAWLSVSLSLADFATNISILVDFADVSLSGFPFIFSLSTLAVGPHVLTLYEAVNGVGMTGHQRFSIWQAVLNQLHIRTAVQTGYKLISVTRARRDGGARAAQCEAALHATKSLQVKMILALSVALPELVLQVGQLVLGTLPLGWLEVLSASLSLLVIGDAMGEFTLRAGDTPLVHALHMLFCAPLMGCLFLGFTLLFVASPGAACGVLAGVFVANMFLVRLASHFIPDFTASSKPLTLLTDAALYTIGFVDVNFPHPTADVPFACKTAAECVLDLALPLLWEDSLRSGVHTTVVHIAAPLGGAAAVALCALLVERRCRRRRTNSDVVPTS